MKSVRRSSVLLVVLLSLALTHVRAVAQWPPDSITNLQVLRRDMPLDSLVQLMAGFTRALGIRCSTCHMGEESQPLAEYDFASDDKPMKRKARAMLEMVNAINTRHLASLETRNDPPIQVECFTCHRGAREPRKLQDVLIAAWQAGGVDSITTAYHALRERYHGRAVFSFDEVALADVSQAVEAGGSMADAARLDSLNMAMNPSSGFAQRLYVLRALHVAYNLNVDSGRARFEQFAKDFEATLYSEPLLMQLGRGFLNRRMHPAAVDLLTRAVERFPESGSAHALLADAHAANDDVASAIRHYERALAIDPGNANVAEKLRAIRAR